MRAVALLLVVLGARSALAQARPVPAVGRSPRATAICLRNDCPRAGAVGSLSLGPVEDSPPSRRAPAWAIVASAALPGTGQALLRSERFLPYLAFEAFGWTQYGSHSREAARRRDAYRQLAADVARRPFTVSPRIGNFDYYERLEHFLESGAYDAVPGGQLDPEADTATYNGSIWLLARRTFWKDLDHPPDRTSKEWSDAQQFYERRAYHEAFRWSWRNAQLEYDEYRHLIRQSNDATRKAVEDLGVVLANHALSMVDAYITIRVRRRQDLSVHGYDVSASLPIGRR